MKALFAKDIMSSMRPRFSMRWESIDMSKEILRVTLIPSKLYRLKRHSCIVSLAKRSLFQEFQDFAKPLRLLPASPANTYGRDIFQERISSELDKSSSLYIIELWTSKDFGSSLSDATAAILLCLIDVNGDSILQRISSTSIEHHGGDDEASHFQRGSVDIVTFKGFTLAKIEAIWIGLESGSWRLGDIRMTVVSGPLYLSESAKNVSSIQIDGLQYRFEGNNILFGEKRGVSVVELRPVLITQLSKDNFSAFLSMSSSESSSSEYQKTSNEESMREYADLKLSLLLYDLIFVFGGTITATFFASEKAGYTFLVGGICGFLYLLLLQRSVDELAPQTSPSSAHMMDNIMQAFRGLKGSLLTLSLISATSIAVFKYGIAGESITLTPMELLIGVAGFLSSKIAVVMAAFKPLQRNITQNR